MDALFTTQLVRNCLEIPDWVGQRGDQAAPASLWGLRQRITIEIPTSQGDSLDQIFMQQNFQIIYTEL